MLPPGHVIVNVGVNEPKGEGAEGLRWSSFRQAEVKEIEMRLGDVATAIESYKELSDCASYTTWRDCLHKFFLPAAKDVKAPAALGA